jgi:phosphopantothenoylcysteine decarboxylase/phosphopantothenate--cysteine ligase
MSGAASKQYTMLRDKQIIVGVTGGIAAYKAAELVRTLAKKGANVHVVMTKNAMEFVTPLTFQTLSGNPVTHEMFELLAESKIGHIALSDLADQLVIVPATANIIGKIAGGIADDFLSTMVMATRVPVLFVPAMNTKMWESRIVQGNIDRLRDNGYEFIEPDTGDLACGWEGKGRMPPVEDIIEKMEDIFTAKDLVGERIMVTAGPTQEFIDPVRCITNRSSGKMGYALAKIAHRRGAEVILVTGRTDLPRPSGVEVIDVVTATEMRNAVIQRQANCTVIIKAAAVADFRSKALRYHKIKKKPGEEEVTLELDRNPDILQELGRIKEDRILVGFAAETENLVQNAYEKLKRKNLDLVVANDVTKQGIGFGSDDNEVTIIGARGRAKHVPKLSKEEVAHVILDSVKRVIKKKRKYRDDWY